MFKNYKISYLKYDIPIGIMMAFISIPISMGYAQVAGLPPVYGLYGSIVPTILFGLLTSSKRFYFGVDAVPAALMGTILYSFGIDASTNKAFTLVGVTTVMVSIWLLLFGIFNVGKFVKFISVPVMEGFITGISIEIILMQFPKLFGGISGHGSLLDLLKNILSEFFIHSSFLSMILGFSSIFIILYLKKYYKKIPGGILVMFLGGIFVYTFDLGNLGVNLLPNVEAGLPKFLIPNFFSIEKNEFIRLIIPSFSIALVIVSESLLTTNNYAIKNDEKVNNKREIFTYSVCNLASSLFGSCPVNGSVSRTGIANDFRVKSQVMSVVSGFTMILILLFGTKFIAYLPIPVLTAVVIASLIGILEFRLANRLKKVDRIEWLIFYTVFGAVLLFGTLYGVAAGVLFSFITIIVRASSPYTEFMGCIPKEKNFYPVSRIKDAKPLEGVIIYQFNSSLFFANIGKFQDDIENAVKEDTKIIIVDGRGIGSIDVTATERLLLLYEKFKEKDIKFYLTEHSGSLNDQLREFGAEKLFDEGAIRRSISVALRKCGITYPYILECDSEKGCEVKDKKISDVAVLSPKKTAELEWAFGDKAEEKLKETAEYIAKKILEEKTINENLLKEAEKEKLLCELDVTDEDCLLELIEMELCLIAQENRLDKKEEILGVEKKVIDFHLKLGDSISEKTKDDLTKILEFNAKNERKFKRKNPKAYKEFLREKENYIQKLYEEHPELKGKIIEARKKLEEKKKRRWKIR